MHIPTEQTKEINGASVVIPINPDYTFTQVTLLARNTGVITGTVRPRLERNDPASFLAEEFEHIEGGAVDMAANPRKRTFTIESKRCSALKFADAGAGIYKVFIQQWGRAS